jgi:hypothetical protein
VLQLLAGSSNSAVAAASASEGLFTWLRSFPALLAVWSAARPALTAEALTTLLDVVKRTPAATAAQQQPQSTATASAVPAVAQPVWCSEAQALCSWLPAALTPLLQPSALAALPLLAQRTVAALLYHLQLPAVDTAESDALLSALCAACGSLAVPHATRSFLLEVVQHKRRALSPSAYLTFLVGVLLGGREGEAVPPGAATVAVGKSRKRKSKDKAAAATAVQPAADAAANSSSSSSGAASSDAVWAEAVARDAVTEDVCTCLAVVGGHSRGASLLTALQPHLLPLLAPAASTAPAAAVTAAVLAPPKAQQLWDFRIAAAVVLTCLQCCGASQSATAAAPAAAAPAADAVVAAVAPLLSALAQSCTAVLAAPLAGPARQGAAATAAAAAAGASMHAPVVLLLRAVPALLAAVLSAAVSAVQSAASTGRPRDAEALLVALQGLMRGGSVVRCTEEVCAIVVLDIHFKVFASC